MEHDHGRCWCGSPIFYKGALNMRKYIGLALIWGWYFTATMPDELVKGANIVMIVGPMRTEGECRERLAASQDLFDTLGVKADWSKCKYIQET